MLMQHIGRLCVAMAPLGVVAHYQGQLIGHKRGALSPSSFVDPSLIAASMRQSQGPAYITGNAGDTDKKTYNVSTPNHFVQYAGQNCGLGDDLSVYMPGGNATQNLVTLFNATDSEVDHLTKCARKCAQFDTDGVNGCGGFVYEKEAVTGTGAKLTGVQGSCTLRRGPINMTACSGEASAHTYTRMQAEVTFS
ncbi:unnamed protein product [Amoebophrya sp. A25]|nr:unnamed protein product [Amoebophrya sp. A25]|eukprot:GSA25T00018045001.1